MAVAHNGSKYDFKFVLHELAYRDCEISVIGQSSENFMSINAKYKVGEYIDKKTGKSKPEYFSIRFIDSIRFLLYSLETLVLNQQGNLPITKQFFTEEEFNLIKRKGIYPYDDFTSLEWLMETELPNWRISTQNSKDQISLRKNTYSLN